jgi:hypothetical protein
MKVVKVVEVDGGREEEERRLVVVGGSCEKKLGVRFSEASLSLIPVLPLPTPHLSDLEYLMNHPHRCSP